MFGLFGKKEEFDVSAEFDIERFDVYAIQRNHDGDTQIYFFDKDGESTHLYLATTNEKHKELVDRLAKKLESKHAND